MIGSFFVGTRFASKDVKLENSQINKSVVPVHKLRALDGLKIESLINKEREKAGLPLLAHADKLAQSACSKLDDMVAKDYWAHIAPDGTDPWYWIKSTGYEYFNAGENLAYGFNSEAEMVAGWMTSPTHKANILGNFTEQGVCTKAVKYRGSDTTLPAVSHFGTPLQ